MDSTAQKALRVIELFCASPEPRGVSDLARQLALPKSNVHRILKTLEAEGYLRQTTQKTYALTFKIWSLGVMMMSRVDVKSVAPPHMQHLVAATGESCLLAVLDGHDVVYIDKIESNQAIQATTRIGSRIPAHCVGTGKAMLAFQSDDFIESLLPTLKAYTPATVCEPQAVIEQLKLARKRGYSINRGEFRLGVSGVGAAILDQDGRAVAGVGIWGPDDRIAPQIEELGAQVALCAKAISSELGHGDEQAVRTNSKPKQGRM